MRAIRGESKIRPSLVRWQTTRKQTRMLSSSDTMDFLSYYYMKPLFWNSFNGDFFPKRVKERGDRQDLCVVHLAPPPPPCPVFSLLYSFTLLFWQRNVTHPKSGGRVSVPCILWVRLCEPVFVPVCVLSALCACLFWRESWLVGFACVFVLSCVRVYMCVCVCARIFPHPPLLYHHAYFIVLVIYVAIMLFGCVCAFVRVCVRVYLVGILTEWYWIW